MLTKFNQKVKLCNFLDFRKTYDTIEWPFPLSSLKYFGFKDEFIAQIQTLYKHSSRYIYNIKWLEITTQLTKTWQ